MAQAIPRIRLIGLDLDGTTFDRTKSITPRVQDAIRRGIEAGVHILPATGRQLSGVPPEFLGIPGVRYVLCSNGAKVYDLKDMSVIHQHCYTEADALAVLPTIRRFPCLASVFINGESYTDPHNSDRIQDFVAPELVDYFRNSRHLVQDFAEAIRGMGSPVEKYVLNYRDMDIRQQAWEAFTDRGDLEVTSSMPGNLELNTKGCSKGNGLLALGRYLDIGKEEIMAVGDSSNDLQMLQAVGYGVAMGNATPEILAAADWVTASCEKDGVAVAIDRILQAQG